jgi:hypothetical protein
LTFSKNSFFTTCLFEEEPDDEEEDWPIPDEMDNPENEP